MKRFSSIMALITLYACQQSSVKDWQMQPSAIQTRWAKDVNQENVLPEYPRPQMVRKTWTNLNGVWEYAITQKDQKPASFQGGILVPYPVESSLSGVKKSLQPDQSLWYKKTIERPDIEKDERILLHFGAVDFEATVFINEKEVGTHKGGYQNFSFDVTDMLSKDENELLVKVWDPSDKGYNPHGKQVLDPQGIMYTPSSGIWQTVWMETVPANYISGITTTTDIDQSLVKIKVNSIKDADVIIEIEGNKITGKSNNEISVPIQNAKLWSPDAPNLYLLKVQLGTDVVDSYFGMRKIEIKKDEKGIERIFLNNKYTYNLGTLDQGFWPDGLYTAPTDAALKFDIEAAKAMGFNTIRKHIKIEPQRWYYHADKIGMLVWQDMVNAADTVGEAKKQFESECKENIAQLFNHPSIITWVLFNENWGAYDQARLTKWIKDTDPTRLVNGHSGALIVDHHSPANTPEGLAYKSQHSDMTDIHSYPPPGMPAYIPGKAMVLGEFGGIGVSIPSHLWNDVASGWGYGGTVSAGVMRKRYAVMTDSLIAFEKRGLSGSIYTQPFDVESEQNGLITYDREIAKIPAEEIRAIHSKLWPVTANYQATTSTFAVKVADTAKKDFATAYKEYNAGKKDSASLRQLALLAFAERDTITKGGRTIANEYIKNIKDPLAETNIRFIRQFTRSTSDAGFPILINNIERVNNILGDGIAQLAATLAIEQSDIVPLLKAGKPDWVAIRKQVHAKHGEVGTEAVMHTQVMNSINTQNWNALSDILVEWYDKYGSKRKWVNDDMLNTISWATFVNINKPGALEIARKMSKKSVEMKPIPQYMDTYANLLYKLGHKEEAITWQAKAVALSPGDEELVGAYEKMKKGEKTWN